MSVLLIGLSFCTENSDCVNETVNIYHFHNISLSAGSKVSMFTQRWDTALDANTLTSYADASALMKQQRIPPIVGCEAAANMLEQCLVEETFLLSPQERHPTVFKLATLLRAAWEVNFYLRSQVVVQQDILAALF